jgi:hypothetical protein
MDKICGNESKNRKTGKNQPFFTPEQVLSKIFGLNFTHPVRQKDAHSGFNLFYFWTQMTNLLFSFYNLIWGACRNLKHYQILSISSPLRPTFKIGGDQKWSFNLNLCPLDMVGCLELGLALNNINKLLKTIPDQNRHWSDFLPYSDCCCPLLW